MLAKIHSFGISGLDAYPVQIEVDVSHGLPSTAIVGLPDNAIKESKERVRAALKNSGFQFAPDRITINLCPADTKKEGPSFDLAIALGLLAATEQIDIQFIKKFIVLGELSLDGQIQPIHGALSIALSVPKNKYQGIILPAQNALEASLSSDIDIFPVHTLNEVVRFLENPQLISPIKSDKTTTLLSHSKSFDIDFSEVKGQAYVKKGLEVAAAGGHNVLLIGPPGSGKTMLAKRLLTILPDMHFEECLEVTKIYSIAGMTRTEGKIVTNRPFRSPHHTSSDIALVGGGSNPRPGEVTLAHLGILFLDELPEFKRNVLEALRQPLEDYHINISRATKSIQFPAKFMLVSAMNPCPCGWHGVAKKNCSCSSSQIQKYHSKISGPLLDRIDIHLEVNPLKSQEILNYKQPETSLEIKKRTVLAREIQKERFKQTPIYSNAQMNHKQIKHYCSIDNESKNLLKMAMDELGLSARTHDKLLKAARTIADLAGKKEIEADHIAEAIQYRSLDRNFFS